MVDQFYDIFFEENSFEIVNSYPEQAKESNPNKTFLEFPQLLLISEFDINQSSNSTNMTDIKTQPGFSTEVNFEEYPKQIQIKSQKNSEQEQTASKSSKNSKSITKQKKGNTNITKNYIFGILKYIQQHDQQILDWLKENDLQIENPYKFFHEMLNKQKKQLYSLKHLKKLLNEPGVQGKIIRVFGYKFLKEQSFQYFHQKSFKNRIQYIKIKHIIEKAFTAPNSFTHLKN